MGWRHRGKELGGDPSQDRIKVKKMEMVTPPDVLQRSSFSHIVMFLSGRQIAEEKSALHTCTHILHLFHLLASVVYNGELIPQELFFCFMLTFVTNVVTFFTGGHCPNLVKYPLPLLFSGDLAVSSWDLLTELGVAGRTHSLYTCFFAAFALVWHSFEMFPPWFILLLWFWTNVFISHLSALFK